VIPLRFTQAITWGAVVVAGLAPGCVSEKPNDDTRQKRIDDVALAFARYVTRCSYEPRLAAEKNAPAPSVAARLRARTELKEALEAIGLDLPEGDKLAGAFDAVRDALVAHDYVFVPLSQAGNTEDEDLGVAFAHVRRREAARSLDLWERKVEFKLVVFQPLVYDYPTWRARVNRDEGFLYSPGRFSAERQTVYIDHDYCVARAQAQPPETQALGLEGIIREVELRQAAYLMFAKDVKEPSQLEQLHERVLWTAVRYGDPDVAWHDVIGLAAGERYPAELRAAAARVRARLPVSLDSLPNKQARAETLHRIAEEAWRALG
jgi:hypothetical protein